MGLNQTYNFKTLHLLIIEQKKIDFRSAVDCLVLRGKHSISGSCASIYQRKQNAGANKQDLNLLFLCRFMQEDKET